MRNVLLYACILLLAARVYYLKQSYDQTINKPYFTTLESGVRYSVWHQSQAQGTLYIADLLGTNILSRRQLEQFTPPEDGTTAVIIPSIHPVTIDKITVDTLLNVIANQNNVVLADNFCSPDWNNVKSHAWYQGTTLSPGPYCLSEPQTRLVDRLIKQYNVNRVKIYADGKVYARLIDTFIKYTDAMGIKHEIIYLTNP